MGKRLWIFLACLVLIGGADLAYAYATGQLRQPAAKGSWAVAVEPVQVIAEAAKETTASTSTTASAVQANAKLVKVVDGDTLVVRFDDDSKDAKIRLLGINTPEVVDPRKPVEGFGKEASKKMHELVDGKRIRLDSDPQADERDKYGRLLRNIRLEDGTDVNALMVSEGYAYAYLSFPLDKRRKAELKKLENDAKMAQRGLWSSQTCNGGK